MDVAEVLVRYAACIDDRDFEAYRSCFAPDVVLNGFAPEAIHGPDAWIAFVTQVLERFSATQHLLGQPAVTWIGDGARIRCPLQAQHFYREPEGRIFTLWGTYHTDLSHDGEVWRMQRHALDVTATRTDGPPAAPEERRR